MLLIASFDQVGIGSSWHCVVDEFLTTAATSTAVVGLRMDRGLETVLSTLTGADDGNVNAHMKTILFECSFVQDTLKSILKYYLRIISSRHFYKILSLIGSLDDR